jgi:hypothetical protein
MLLIRLCISLVLCDVGHIPHSDKLEHFAVEIIVAPIIALVSFLLLYRLEQFCWTSFRVAFYISFVFSFLDSCCSDAAVCLGYAPSVVKAF